MTTNLRFELVKIEPATKVDEFEITLKLKLLKSDAFELMKMSKGGFVDLEFI